MEIFTSTETIVQGTEEIETIFKEEGLIKRWDFIF